MKIAWGRQGAQSRETASDDMLILSLGCEAGGAPGKLGCQHEYLPILQTELNVGLIGQPG